MGVDAATTATTASGMDRRIGAAGRPTTKSGVLTGGMMVFAAPDAGGTATSIDAGAGSPAA